MSLTFVLVHGAWHSGADFEQVAQHLRSHGHTVHCPTLRGNRPGDDRSALGLEDAIASLVAYFDEHGLHDVRLVGHSYGGMVISGLADRLEKRLARLVYVNAFVPLDGQSVCDMAPPGQEVFFTELAAQNQGQVKLPFPVWREALINDADLAMAQQTYAGLNPQPIRTMTDKIALSRPLAALMVGKSYINCLLDTALPQSLSWHPRLSERLGLFRLVSCEGSHEALFTNPGGLADAILRAARD